MLNRIQPFFAIAVSLLAALTAFVLISVFFQNTTARVLVLGQFSHDTKVTVSALASNGKSVALKSYVVKGSNQKKPQRTGTPQLNVPLSRLKVEFEYLGPESSINESIVKLTSIEVVKPYMNHYYFNGKNIDAYFQSSDTSSGLIREFSFSTKTPSVSLTSNSAIKDTNWGLILGMPILFFFGVLFIIRNSAWSRIPAFSDMSLGHHISSSGEFDAINGVRGLAALLVLFSHTAPGYEAVQVGLALLFVVSGFLLSKPFILDPNKVYSWRNLERYLTKRLKRILPMYYFYVFLIYVIDFKLDLALKHFFFVQAEGHLWPMTQIFLFYVMLPFVLMICCAAYRVHRLMPIALLVIAAYVSVIYARDWTPFYNGRFSKPFYLYAFLMGIIGSYIQYDLIGKRWLEPWGKRWVRELVSLAAIVFVFYLIAWSAPMRPSLAIFHWVSQFWLKCIASVILILLALNTPKTLFRAIIANPLFRSVGVIGFSFYILHGLGMQIFEQVQIQYLADPSPAGRSWRFVAGAFAVTYLMAIVGYSYVERPFFGYRDNSNNSLNNNKKSP